MPFVMSADGTKIACKTHGSGPALLIVDGAIAPALRGFLA